MKRKLLLWGPIGGIASLLLLYLIASVLPLPAPYRATPPSNLILDRKGRVLYEWVQPDASPYRPITLDDLPPYCVQATLATEDRRFYHHPGVDPLAILRSVYRHIRYGAPLTGASTLTQQWVRLTFFPPQERYQRHIGRKLKEAWLAFQAERHMSKGEILAAYFNRAYYGNFAVGIQAAAHTYFGQPVSTLDLAQCALLAGLPQAPTALNPLVHPRRAKARQSYVLRRMVEEGWITDEEAEQARKEPLVYAGTPTTIEAPHFVNWVQNRVEEYLGDTRVRAGGLVITTTLDLDLQHQAERLLRRHLDALNRAPEALAHPKVTNGALVVMDVHTGDILAMVGSPDYFDKTHAGAVNGALALRQPGSAIKPFVYAAAFSPQLPHPWAPPTLIRDALTIFYDEKGNPYIPRNYDMQWHGIVSARVALGASFNVPAVKALRHAGIGRFLDVADRVGLHSLLQAPAKGLALALGAGEISLMELTQAYGVLARGGKHIPPRGLLQIGTLEGTTLWTAPLAEGKQVLDPGVAFLVTDILADPYARIPTFGPHSPLELERPAAAKTGTTTDWRDAWTVGYTPDIVAGVWVGNWDNSPMEYLSGAQAAAPIWQGVMHVAHKGIPPHNFERPGNVKTVRLCASTGLPASADCSLTREDVVLSGTPYALAESADVLAEVQRSPKPNLPSSSSLADGVALLSPEPGAVYVLAPDLPVEEQAIALEVRAPPGSTVTFRVDGVLLGVRTHPPYRLWWPLQVGEHHIRYLVRTPGGGTRTLDTEIRVLRPGP